jgi:integrase
MTLPAQCTGLRIEEILALNWDKIEFERLCMKIEKPWCMGESVL